MAKLRVFSVKKLGLDAAGFTHVKMPDTGFSVVLTPDKTLVLLLQEPKLRQQIDAAAIGAYKKFLLQTAKRLQKFDKLFASMLAKGAAPDVVAAQADALKTALEKETPKWEKAAAHEVMDVLKKLAKKKR